MSFDIVMRSSRRSGRTTDFRNPFTGETQTVELDDPLTQNERTALRDLLVQHGAGSPDRFGYYTASLNGNISVEVQFKGLLDDPDFTGGTIEIHGDPAPILQFLFAIGDAGNFLIQPAMNGNPEIVTKPAVAEAVAERFPRILLAQSPADFGAIILSGVASWDEFRRRVT